MQKDFTGTQIIGAAIGLGAKLKGTSKAPKVLGVQNIIQTLNNFEQKEFQNGKATLSPLLDFYQKLSSEISATINKKKFPLIVGGDHSIAVSTWSTVVNDLDAFDAFGLIWIDAHLDSHTYETSPSKAYHGMPVAHLLGYGEPEFKEFLNKERKINPKYLVFIGARSYEKEEKELLDKLGVRIITMDEVNRRSFNECFKEALTIVNAAPKGFGISLDIDFFDPEFAPGVGSPAGGGANPDDVLPSLIQQLKNNGHLKALEISEFNPEKDKNDITKVLCLNIIKILCS